MKKLIQIQSELKTQKNQFNRFGNYKYRSCEDILESVKPLLLNHQCILTIKDRLLTVNNLMYIEAVCTFSDGENTIKVKAQAGIDPNTKGMHLAQCFGASSSYARKYALSGLFLIDDTKDADATNTHQIAAKQATAAIISTEDSEIISQALEHLKKIENKDDLVLLWDSLDEKEQTKLKAIFSKKKNLIMLKDINKFDTLEEIEIFLSNNKQVSLNNEVMKAVAAKKLLITQNNK